MLDYVSEDRIIFSFIGVNMITLPGYGPVSGSAGKVSFLVDTSTPEWTIIEVVQWVGTPFPEDWDAVCEYLGS